MQNVFFDTNETHQQYMPIVKGSQMHYFYIHTLP
jgi:hypothetical protein